MDWLLAAVVGIVSFWLYGRHTHKQGRKKLADELLQEDLRNVESTVEKLDAVRTDGDTINRLRKQGRLRD